MTEVTLQEHFPGLTTDDLDYIQKISLDILLWIQELYNGKNKITQFKLSECKEHFPKISEKYLTQGCQMLVIKGLLALDSSSRIAKYTLLAIPEPAVVDDKIDETKKRKISAQDDSSIISNANTSDKLKKAQRSKRMHDQFYSEAESDAEDLENVRKAVQKKSSSASKKQKLSEISGSNKSILGENKDLLNQSISQSNITIPVVAVTDLKQSLGTVTKVIENSMFPDATAKVSQIPTKSKEDETTEKYYSEIEKALFDQFYRDSTEEVNYQLFLNEVVNMLAAKGEGNNITMRETVEECLSNIEKNNKIMICDDLILRV